MRQAYEKLEKLVYERTAELLQANNILKQAIGERRRAEMLLREAHTNLESIVEEGLKLHFPNLSSQERQQRVADMLTEVGLDPAMMDRYPHEFSGGQRQRISIARAMVLRPQFVTDGL